MKVILSETQLNALLHTEGVSQLLQESVGDSERFKKIILRLLASGVAVATIINAINKIDAPMQEKEELAQLVTDYQGEMDRENSDSIFQQKVNACRAYMEYALKNQNYTLESTDLKPETLVKASIEKNFDLPFLMAVAHQESCFGATPRAKRTNSVFSVGSYDNGKDVVNYSDPNDSVYGYIDLLNKSYMVNGKSLFDLLKPGGFVNGIGKRYASDANYENKISYLRYKIIKKFPELS